MRTACVLLVACVLPSWEVVPSRHERKKKKQRGGQRRVESGDRPPLTVKDTPDVDRGGVNQPTTQYIVNITNSRDFSVGDHILTSEARHMLESPSATTFSNRDDVFVRKHDVHFVVKERLCPKKANPVPQKLNEKETYDSPPLAVTNPSGFDIPDLDQPSENPGLTGATSENKWSLARTRKKSKTEVKQSPEQSTVEQLLSTTPGPGLIVRESDLTYTQNREQFSLDVVSMWNTPGISGHILLGVRSTSTLPHEVTGLSGHLTEEQVQELFLTESFSARPVFGYTEVHIEGRRVGLLTVANSRGQGSAITIKKACTAEPEFRENELWYRKENDNVKCMFSEPSTTMDIYAWFTGSKAPTDPPKVMEGAQTLGRTNCLSSLDLSGYLKLFTKGHFILIVGQIRSSTPNLGMLMKLPWVYVFDFDVNSRVNGTFAACESALKERRSLYVRQWNMKPVAVSENATSWCFVRGVNDLVESLAEEDSKAWMRKTKKDLEKHCDQLSQFADNYTTLRVLVVWPDLDFCSIHLILFLQMLEEILQPEIQINISSAQDSTDSKKAKDMLNALLGIELAEPVSVEMLCNEINVRFRDDQKIGPERLKLPGSCKDGTIEVEVSEQDQLWFREDLDVLYLKSPYSKSSDTEAVTEDIDNFFKGGTLHWYTRYECDAGHVDIQRDVMDNILPALTQLYQKYCKPTIITLAHSPGSGGTTLAQRLLWDLHTKTPCAQVKAGSGSTLEEMSNKIKRLNEVTGSTVCILIDGEDETRVKQLARQLSRISTIILYVKRYPYQFRSGKKQSSPNTKIESRYYLTGKVTEDEAKRLTINLKGRIHHPAKKIELDVLTKDVSKGNSHCLYEFGLTAYLHEFRGVESYVKGYLELDTNPTRDLVMWQKILGYLALVYYYGQASVPCQFFVSILGKPPNYDVSLDDFPENAREFIREDATKSKYIRISHHIIAQEILEQILTRHRSTKIVSRNQDDRTTLSKLAKQNLKVLAEDFIEYSGKKKTQRGMVSTTITLILTKTFIFRENQDVAVRLDEVHVKKPYLPELIEDIECSSPYTERLVIYEKLSQCFPEDPHFHAHLGRFYTNWRPGDEEKAEKCFETALEKCDKLDKTDDKVKQTLIHVYHMYGMVYLRKIRSQTKEYSLTKEQIMEVFHKTKKACELFTNCRHYTPLGQVQSHGYVGEMSARLAICGAIEKTSGDINTYLKDKSSNPELVEFVTDSISQVDNLIMECYHYVDHEDLDKLFYTNVQLFNITFGKEAESLERLITHQGPAARRLRIAAKKMNCVTNVKHMLTLENVSRQDITEIVTMYESNFREVQESGDIGNRRALEMDYKEWMLAIRHDKLEQTYDLEDVRTKVDKWRENLSTPYSLFYLFVVTSLIGFGEKGKSARTSSLTTAKDLGEMLRRESKNIAHPRHPREWLGKGDGIRQLIPGTPQSHGHFDISQRRMKGSLEPLLKVCKGTICAGNKLRSGFIALDLGNASIQVKVFFIPKVCNLEGQRFEGERVEFLLAFTLDKGYEAFNVRPLDKQLCPGCKAMVEIKSDEDQTKCHCKRTVFRMDDIR